MIPASLQINPEISRWLKLTPDRKILLRVGKIEYGQGVLTALLQIAAEELDLEVDQLSIRAGDTEAAPDEGLTVGSMSLEVSGASVRLVCGQARRLYLAAAASRLGCRADELRVEAGAILKGAQSTGLDYWSLAGDVDLDQPVPEDAPVRSPDAYRVVGKSVARIDLPEKLAGGGFLADLAFPDLVHARVLRQPSPGARLRALKAEAVTQVSPEAVEVLREGDFVAVVSRSETAVERAVAAAEAVAVWDDPRRLAPAQAEASWLRGQPNTEQVTGEPAASSGGRVHRTSYSRAYLSHGSMGPSCAVAQVADGRLTVWSHTQGVYPLRAMIARATGLEADRIVVRHAQGAGCYGHNGADDVALDAAAIAIRRPGPAVRVQWRREDEFGFEPLGPAMIADITAALDGSGRPQAWTVDIWSGAHGDRSRLLAEAALGGGEAPSPSNRRFSGAVRNAQPGYDVGPCVIVDHLVQSPPVRTSALRGLGANVNVFAIEGAMDELADLADEDPLAYRLSLLSDSRGRRVLEKTAEMAGWARRDGRTLGLGYCRYKGSGAYAAVVAEVEVGEAVGVRRLWCAADAGLVVNPDGARNQLEGGMIMAVSWALKEQVRFDEAGVASRSWGDYPILRFSEIPAIEIALIEARDQPPSGLGEASPPPTLAAIGNAVSRGLGVRARDMPFTRERLAGLLLKA